MIAYTVMADSPPITKSMLFTNKTVTLTIACLIKVTEPREEISLTRLNLKLKQLSFNLKDFFETKI